MHVALCGYPGSGKSTVFRALSPGAQAARSGGRGKPAYGSIKVPDARVDRLADFYHPRRKVYAEVVFMDLPGEAGQGGAFPPSTVQALRNADVLAHVVRAFDSPYLSEPPDPERDVARFLEECVLLDLAIIERRAQRWKKEGRKGEAVEVNQRCLEWLEEGRSLRDLGLSEQERRTLSDIQLLSLKPLLTVYNVAEEDWEDPRWRELDEPGALALCGSLEAELGELEPEDRAELMEGLGLEEPASATFIRAAYGMLDLISFLTAGEDECRAWPLRRGSTARQAAGRIHSDLERGFIRAEVFRLEDLEELGSEAAIRAAGRLRVEGKDYIVQDGDILNIRFNV